MEGNSNENQMDDFIDYTGGNEKHYSEYQETEEPRGNIMEMVSNMNNRSKTVSSKAKEARMKKGESLLESLIGKKPKSSAKKEQKQDFVVPEANFEARPDYLNVNLNARMEEMEIEPVEDQVDYTMEDIYQEDEDSVRNRKIKKKKKVVTSEKRKILVEPEKKQNLSPLRRSPRLLKAVKTPEKEVNRALSFSSSPKVDSGFKPRTMSTATDFAVESDGSVLFYWYDAIEERIRGKNVVILFGKVRVQGSIDKYSSLSVVIKNITRKSYVLPTDSTGQVAEEDLYNEFSSKLNQMCPGIKEFKAKFIKRKYCFELDIERGEHSLMKVITSCDEPKVPQNMFGQTFRHVFNTQQTLLERLILSRRIKGPCWLRLTDFVKAKGASADTNSVFEVALNNFKSLSVLQEKAPKAPPMNIAAVNLKMSGKDIVGASLMFSQNYVIGQETAQKSLKSVKMVACPANYRDKNAFQQDLRSNNGDTKVFTQEFQLLNYLLNQINQFDADVICGHNLYKGIIEPILDKVNKKKLSKWTLLGKMKRNNFPKALPHKNNSLFRISMAGRLPLCTYSSAKDMLRESNYSVSFLAEKYLQKAVEDIDFTKIPLLTRDSQGLTKLLSVMEAENEYSFKLGDHLKVLQLTRELTSIAGNLWVKSLEFSRNDRNEYLLLHNFNAQKYILPDKFYKTEEEDKHKYSGGLVLEPESDLYNTVILLLDFNSLYPSIIQEYNLCFCTVDRPPTQSPANQFKLKKDKKEEDEEKLVESIDVNKIKEERSHSILPNLLSNLVGRRSQVKNQLKKETDPAKCELLDIKQKAFKLTANSLYGCLGYKNSRFYARTIAALITSTGRNILKETANLVKENEHHVIYGDTDSIMVNTRQNNYDAAEKMAQEIKRLVNQKYKLLEIDLDGLFKCLLLLKKKKYAAIKVDKVKGNWVESKEFKGLDLVRRDWCNLSKHVGYSLMDILLSGKEHDDVAAQILALIETLNESIAAGKVPLTDYYMTKQLSKEVEEYGKKTNLPHVEVARRLKAKGEAINAGMHINYLVCKTEGKGNLKDKAFHPTEFEEQSLEIDTDFYKENQLIPSIKRLCKHIKVLEMDQIREKLGLRKREFDQSTVVVSTEETSSVFGFSVHCLNCAKVISINKFSEGDFLKKLTCECGKEMTHQEALISNSVLFALKSTLREHLMCQSRKGNGGVTRLFFDLEEDSKRKEIHPAKNVSNDVSFLFKFVEVYCAAIKPHEKGPMRRTLAAIQDVKYHLEFDQVDLESVFSQLI